MLDIETALTFLSQFLGIGIIACLMFFIDRRVWPWFIERSTVERDRRHEVKLQHMANDAQMAVAISSGSQALMALGEAISGCPIRPEVGPPGANGELL